MTERETQPTADDKYTVHSMTHTNSTCTYMYTYNIHAPSNVSYNLHSIHSGINIHVHV